MIKNDDDGPDIDEEGISLWQEIVKSITPFKKQNKHASTNFEAKRKETKANEQEKIAFQDTSLDFTLESENTPKPKGTEIDKKLDQRLKRGQLPIDYTLDLHGHTQNQAQDSLRATLLKCHTLEKRCVLVITGKGKHKDGQPGVLKQRVPEWLRDAPLKDIVLKTYPAKPQHGGDGALYVLLRRKRP